MELAKIIHNALSTLPRSELYILGAQIRRAAISIPSNIAEGSQRTGDKEFAHFLSIAKGSLAELQTQIILGEDFGYFQSVDTKRIYSLISELDRMLHAFRAKLVA